MIKNKLLKTLVFCILCAQASIISSLPVYAAESDDAASFFEKTVEYRFSDGAGVRVHYSDEILEESGESPYFPKDVLDAAVFAYQSIVQFQGFSAPGYSFANPTENYAYDPDRVIDIYLGQDSKKNGGFFSFGNKRLSFKDAPCFDTIAESETAYQAIILLPANYREFIKNWERVNPSSLGGRNISVDLRGTLMHEMLHAMIFYYNKNLNKAIGGHNHTSNAETPQDTSLQNKVDWYVEGLARYFETFAGAKHDFFSQGFKETLPDKIRFSRGGSNYFMRYPDQAFVDLRYENALFWRFIDHHYGMQAIEQMSRELRNTPNANLEDFFEKAIGVEMAELLKAFAMASLTKDFGLKDESPYLKEVAKTHLHYKERAFYLLDGKGGERLLGPGCSIDWVGEWEGTRAALGEFSVAGDNTDKSDVSGWATDFYQIDVTVKNKEKLPWLGVWHRSGGLPLEVQAVLVTKGGSRFIENIGKIEVSKVQGVDLEKIIQKKSLKASDVKAIQLLVTNTDPSLSADYEIVSHPLFS